MLVVNRKRRDSRMSHGLMRFDSSGVPLKNRPKDTKDFALDQELLADLVESVNVVKA